MIFYNPTDREAYTWGIDYYPRTCFVMTKIGDQVPEEINRIRNRLNRILADKEITPIDANTFIRGSDFKMKIWKMLRGVPLGIAIISRDMDYITFSNIFYEIGLMEAYGKEILVIKTEDIDIPSDFVRDEYIEYPKDFLKSMRKFLKSFSELPEHYAKMAQQLEADPLLAIDYLKRAYLISGDRTYLEKAYEFYQQSPIKDRPKNSVEMLLIDFCLPKKSLQKVSSGSKVKAPTVAPGGDKINE